MTAVVSPQDTEAQHAVLLQAGFRPFFLVGTLYAAASLVVWLLIFAGVVLPWPGAWPVIYWHGHEMLFGFVATAIAGFLLTAVPNWTGTPRVAGAPLALLVAAWLLGRAALWGALWLPAWSPLGLVAAADLLFFPALAVAVGRPILRAGKRHNYPVLGVLVLLAAANLLMHAAVLGVAPFGLRLGLHASLYLVCALLAIIAGRIVPLFTRNTLRGRGVAAAVEPSAGVERALVPVMALAVMALVLLPASLATGVLCLACGGLLVLRQLRWQPQRTLGVPILWVLHVGHAWLAFGFLCLGANVFSPLLPASTAMHALSAGAIGTMIVGVMTRVSLGHSGREIRATPLIVAAYALVIIGGAIRVLGPLLIPDAYRTTVLWAGTTWSAGYLLAAIACWPVLTQPRVDERA
jgi:uncharacterized protein involved in response to NO